MERLVRQHRGACVECGSFDVAVVAGYDYLVAVWVLHPELAVVGKRVDLDWFQHMGPSAHGPLEGGRYARLMEPQHYAIPVRRGRGISEIRMLMSIPFMQLKDQFLIRQELLVLASTTPAGETEHALVPSACGLDILYGNHGLRLQGGGLPTMVACAA
nr:putative integron gene cassette protein [uncultured bacterium]